MARLVVCLCLMLCALLGQVARAADADLIAGFRAIVMQPEYSNRNTSRDVVRKFPGRVRYRLHNRSRFDRTAEAERFVESLGERIPGLDVGLAAGAERANFEVFIVDRADYVSVVGSEIYRRRIRHAPGRCVVTAFERSGRIERSVAVIVADEGDAVFTRCLNEELSQDLAP